MDLFNTNVSGRSAGSRRRNEVREYNEYIQNQLDDRKSRIEQLEDDRIQEQDLNRLTSQAEAIKSGITGAINVGVGKADLSEYLAKSAGKAIEIDETAQASRNVGSAMEGFDSLGVGVTSTDDLTDAGRALASGEGIITQGGRVATATKLMGGVGRAVKAGGSYMNIGLGGYDAFEDIRAGEIQGDTWEAKTSNVLQMASGALDLIGLATGQPEIMALGALAGVGSAVFNEAGELDSQSQRVEGTNEEFKENEKQIQEEKQAPKLEGASSYGASTSEQARVRG
tara:strand:+ start:2402 stop:3250 length:849 start_codon:yes stop_codon:yes gene_type:complete